jgi:hypothetical protein
VVVGRTGDRGERSPVPWLRHPPCPRRPPLTRPDQTQLQKIHKKKSDLSKVKKSIRRRRKGRSEGGSTCCGSDPRHGDGIAGEGFFRARGGRGLDLERRWGEEGRRRRGIERRRRRGAEGFGFGFGFGGGRRRGGQVLGWALVWSSAYSFWFWWGGVGFSIQFHLKLHPPRAPGVIAVGLWRGEPQKLSAPC